MKQLFKHFALLVMSALISGCAAEVDDLQPTTNGTVTMKTTISLSEQATTRALTEAGVKTFEVGDKIAVIYKNTNDETMKVESVALTTDDIDATDPHKATFSVSLTNPKASTPVRYIYPASRAAETVATTTAPNDDATIKYDALATQVGTFDKIASDLDLSVFDGDMTAQGNLPKTATLENPLTIAKFTIKNNATDGDITNTITKLTISDVTNTYTVNRTAADGPIYVAMKPVDNKTVTVSVTANNNKYSDKSVSVTQLAKNTIYPINVSLTARYPFAATDTKLSSEDIGCVVTTDGNVYATAAAATAASKTAAAMIAYVGSASDCAHGLAIALEDVSENKLTWNNSGTNNDSKTAAEWCSAWNTSKKVTGGTWRLPSIKDWQYMFIGCGASATYSDNPNGVNMSYSGLASKLSTANGTALQKNYYWSSPEIYVGYYAWHLYFFSDRFTLFSNGTETYAYHVRACLAF